MKTSHDLRQQLKQRRSALTKVQQQLAAARVNARLSRQHSSKPIASYLSFGAELSTKPLNQSLCRKGNKVYVPIVRENQQMEFVRYAPFAQHYKNQYGIFEPRYTPQRAISPRQLDSVFVPLVGFDQQGNRLGMGGGYYDRYLAKLPKSTNTIGLAHGCQRCRQLKPEPWDQPLHAVVTPRYQLRFKRRIKA